MTPAEFRAVRTRHKITVERLAAMLGLASGRTVRRYQSGETAIPQRVALVMQLIDSNQSVRDELGLTQAGLARAIGYSKR